MSITERVSLRVQAAEYTAAAHDLLERDLYGHLDEALLLAEKCDQ